MAEVFAGHVLLNKHGVKVDPEESLSNKVVGLYFSAGWCCDFTPMLYDFYSELVEERGAAVQFAVVFISSDKSAEDMMKYYHDMHEDWLALPWTDQYKDELEKRYNVITVPKLVIVKENGQVITHNGMKEIQERGPAGFRNWLEVAEVFQNFSC